VPGSAELGFDLARQGLRGARVPLRQQTGVHQRVAALDVDQRAAPQPIEELVAVGRRDHLVERVVLAAFDVTAGERQKVEVVVAEHDHGALAQIAHEAQHRERRRAAVDEVAHEPQPVPGAIEPRELEQALQLLEAALDVADRVGGQAILPARCRCGG